MEILNSVWGALSTENEALVDVISIPLIFLEVFLSLLLFTSILKITASKKEKILYVIFSSLVSIITTYFLPNPFNTFINYVCLFFIVKFIFKTNIFQTLIAVIFPIAIFALIVTLFCNPYIRIIGISFDQFQNTPIYKMPFLLFTYLCVLLLSLIIRYKNTYTVDLNLLTKNSKKIFFLNLIFGLIVLFSQGFLIGYYLDTLPVLYTILSFVSLFAYFALSIYSLTKVLKLETTTQELKNAEEYNKTLQILHDNVRCFKHDFDNIVTTIGGYIATDDMDGLKKYYSELEKDCKRVNNLYILNPKIVNNPGVYSLLVNKYKRAQELNINMTIEFMLNLDDLNIEIYEFTRILGILLDNAIEAAKDSKEKVINVIFRAEDTRHRKVVIVENSYSNKNVDINEIFNKGVTEKKEHTGLGLYKVKKILSKNNNLNLFTTKSNKYFKQQLEIY